jgi:serine/threonine-protein kinase
MSEEIVLERYRVCRELATGGMGEVLLAQTLPPLPPRLVVIKRLLPHLRADAALVELFREECALARLLVHPNITRVLEAGESPLGPVLVLEYVDGLSARALAQQLAKQGAPLDFRAAAFLIARACEGLGAVHTLKDEVTQKPMGVVHRDLSPDNLLLSRDGTVKLTDFGIARAHSRAPRTAPGTVRGKFAYLAPEQLQEQPATPRSDLWALGVTLFELIAGARPFGGDNDGALVSAICNDPPPSLCALRPEVPEALEALVLSCLSKDPAGRPADAFALAARLDAVLAVNPPPVSRQTLAELVSTHAPPPPEAATEELPGGGRALSLSGRVEVSPGAALPPLVAPPTDLPMEFARVPKAKSSVALPDVRPGRLPMPETTAAAGTDRSLMLGFGLVLALGVGIVGWLAATHETPVLVFDAGIAIEPDVLVPPPAPGVTLGHAPAVPGAHAPVAAPTAEPGRVVLESVPDRATVTVNGAEVGQTPLGRRQLRQGAL